MRRRLFLPPAEAVRQYGGEVLASPGMALERGFLQHGRVSVFQHSVQAAYLCALWARALRLPVDGRSLVRGRCSTITSFTTGTRRTPGTGSTACTMPGGPWKTPGGNTA